MKKNNATSEAVNHQKCNDQMKNEKEHDLQLLMYHSTFSFFI
jgi:hypothetical protein